MVFIFVFLIRKQFVAILYKMSIVSKTIQERGMGVLDKAKYAMNTRSYGSPIQLEDIVYYYLYPTADGREQSSLQSEFLERRINIERLLSIDLGQITLDALQYYVNNKPETFASFTMFDGRIINLKNFCNDLALHAEKNKAKKTELASTEAKEEELASTEAKEDEISNIDFITKSSKYDVFEAKTTSSYTTFNAIKCIWVIYELLKKKYNRETRQMTLPEVNTLFEGKIKTLIEKLNSRCSTIQTSVFTMTEYKEMLSIGDIGKYMGKRDGGKTRKRRMARRRRCKTRSKSKNRR
jgi:hypothetical protein